MTVTDMWHLKMIRLEARSVLLKILKSMPVLFNCQIHPVLAMLLLLDSLNT